MDTSVCGEMGSLADPDALYFLRRSSYSHRATATHSRLSEWNSRRLDERRFLRMLNEAKELEKCTFAPEITAHARRLTGPFHHRLERDILHRGHSQVITEFLRQRKTCKDETHSFAPDLSLTRRYKLRNATYLKTPISIPHDCN